MNPDRDPGPELEVQAEPASLSASHGAGPSLLLVVAGPGPPGPPGARAPPASLARPASHGGPARAL
jgi:hypothetical protein